MSGAEWPVTLSDMLLAVGMLLLLFEVIKGARPGAKYLTDHLLSLIVFGAAAAEFVLWPKFGTSTYFLLTALALVDFLSGLACAGVAARRWQPQLRFPGRAQDRPRRRSLSRHSSLRVQRRPAAASVAEPVLDHPSARAVRGPQCGVAGSRLTWSAAGQQCATIAGRAAALIVVPKRLT